VIDLVDVIADAGFEPVIGLADRDDAAAEPADRERGVARVGRAVVQRWDELRQLLRVYGVRPVEQSAVNDGQRAGDLLRILCTAAGGNDHDRRVGVGAWLRDLALGASLFRIGSAGLCVCHYRQAARR
jgi:hypothetical protein